MRVDGRGIRVTMSGEADIRHNAGGTQGCGVYIEAGGTFIMSGGRIRGNRSTNGSTIDGTGTMIWNGGEINSSACAAANLS